PHGDGPGGGKTRHPATLHQLQGSSANAGGVPAPAGTWGSAGRRSPLAPVLRGPRCRRQPSSRRPPRPLRAPPDQAETQPLRLADRTSRQDQTQDGERGYPDLSTIRVPDRRAQELVPPLSQSLGARVSEPTISSSGRLRCLCTAIVRGCL